jgi:hypothetical protein
MRLHANFPSIRKSGMSLSRFSEFSGKTQRVYLVEMLRSAGGFDAVDLLFGETSHAQVELDIRRRGGEITEGARSIP